MDDFDVEKMLDEKMYSKNSSPASEVDNANEKDDGHKENESRKRSKRSRSRDRSKRSKSRERSKRSKSRERKKRDRGDGYDEDDKRESPKKDKDKKRDRSGSREVNGRSKHRSRSRSKSRDVVKERHRSKDRERDRERDRDRDRKSRDRIDRSSKKDTKKRSRSREGSKRRSRERRHGRSQSRERHRRSRERERERERRHTHSRERRLSPIKERFRRRSRSRSRDNKRSSRSYRRSRSPRPFRRGRASPFGDRSPLEELSPEERDARTVFCMQLSQRIRARDLEEFFSSVGKVRDVRLIMCNKTKRFKGIAYVEFRDPESVALALGLSGQRLLGIPISVQHTQAEKNRIANLQPTFTPKPHTGPMRLYVGSLHFDITEEMLRGIFEPFGKINNIQLAKDPETGHSKGYGFITFNDSEDAKKALEQLNGFELAGRQMKVGNVTERLDMNDTSLDTDEMDRSGIDLGPTGRLQLMFKLAEGAGLAVPQAAANALLASAPQPVSVQQIPQDTPPIATQCIMLSNMFDPHTETNPNWDSEIRDDVIEECSKHGGVLHIFVDKVSPTGNVYVKCPSITTAVLAVNALHGRWFAGRVITAHYVPLINYHALFPDSIAGVNLLTTNRKAAEES